MVIDRPVARLPPAEKDGDKRLTYDVPEAGQSLDARRRARRL
jgi:hypothetical protein